ncbi:MAG: hypothetical protein WC365_06480 [Candidatus Babeliales bacterium]|jgi:ribosomal protein S15P/S13E
MTEQKNKEQAVENTDIKTQEEIAQRFLKKINVSMPSDQTKQALQNGLDLLQNLLGEITRKQQEINERSQQLKTKISDLNTHSKIKISEKDFEHIHAQCEQFMQLLGKIIQETERDITFYTPLLSGQGEQISVMIFEPDDCEEFLIKRVAAIKKHVKRTLKDLAVGASRYFLGLDNQLRQLEALENYIKRNN